MKARLDAVLAAHQSADVGETAPDNGNLADRLRSGPSTTAREVAWKPLLLIAAVIVVAIIVAAMLPGR
jgi:hypothetical protein